VRTSARSSEDETSTTEGKVRGETEKEEDDEGRWAAIDQASRQMRLEKRGRQKRVGKTKEKKEVREDSSARR